MNLVGTLRNDKIRSAPHRWGPWRNRGNQHETLGSLRLDRRNGRKGGGGPAYRETGRRSSTERSTVPLTGVRLDVSEQAGTVREDL